MTFSLYDRDEIASRLRTLRILAIIEPPPQFGVGNPYYGNRRFGHGQR
jgi:hypothetical protein